MLKLTKIGHELFVGGIEPASDTVAVIMSAKSVAKSGSGSARSVSVSVPVARASRKSAAAIESERLITQAPGSLLIPLPAERSKAPNSSV
jgi:hypothetical protein